MGEATILIVEPETGLRDRLAAVVEAGDFKVLTCSGPIAPNYPCVGVQGLGCPLTLVSDVVVMDLALDSDLMIEGASAVELIAHYVEEGKPVIALARDGAGQMHPFIEEHVSVLAWPAGQGELISTLNHHLDRPEQVDHPPGRRTVLEICS